MPYANLEALIERAGEAEILQVADQDGDDVADADVVAAALDHADNLVNSYLAARYAMPLGPVPPMVVTWAVAIARYYLHRDGPPDYVVRDYRDTLNHLALAAQGNIAIPGLDGATPEASGAGRVLITGPAPVFTAEKLQGWL
ncbi:gp436 family protein [Ensifer soli]|uniref:gp436 family protein n=1 Tax=Ciceribacter sp. sgz301302 TaxID=3342379 RepID=UPI0035B94563